MPYKHTVRFYAAEEYYHLFNRGVNKQNIFTSPDDYNFFIDTLFAYIYPNTTPPAKPIIQPKEVEIVAYCLMPNHYHLLVTQHSPDAISRLMKAFTNSYVRYFNTQHSRRGPLFESKYKSIIIPSDTYLLHLSRYIHRNPLSFWKNPLKDYPYSSYLAYLTSDTTRLNPHVVLDQFGPTPSSQLNVKYQTFVEYESDITLPKSVLIDVS